eukprot:352690-Chlamydomonas_euryale.AAC.2
MPQLTGIRQPIRLPLCKEGMCGRSTRVVVTTPPALPPLSPLPRSRGRIHTSTLAAVCRDPPSHIVEPHPTNQGWARRLWFKRRDVSFASFSRLL